MVAIADPEEQAVAQHDRERPGRHPQDGPAKWVKTGGAGSPTRLARPATASSGN